ncbi:MAG: 23S rRNA (guanosine(2251)-2'-O)-methyltransferase RlmB [Bdellovibrionaceae bacterium]|nr:23S rRNA (guanosine(2251)-2'-O)-methyltransferase RlmB [Pseudobdellovibrionaceae bacterium]
MSIRKVIGIHSCREALKIRKAQELKKMYLKQGWEKNSSLRELANLAQVKNLQPEIVSIKKINRLIQSIEELHQGVYLEIEHSFDFNKVSFSESATILVLDRVQDPRNFGAIIRTAWLMGVSALFISSKNSVGLTPSVVKSASGGVEHVPIFVKDNLSQYLKELKNKKFWIYALDSRSSKLIWDENLKGPKVFILGGEGLGIRKSLKNICDESLSIPQTEKNSNYNVSVVTAIVLSEALRQTL